MKRYSVGIALAWILATAASVFAATTAVDAVRERVTDRPSALVSAEALPTSGVRDDVGAASRPTVPATIPAGDVDTTESPDGVDQVPLNSSDDATTTSDSLGTTTTSVASTQSTSGPDTVVSSSSATTRTPSTSTPTTATTQTAPPPPPPPTTTTTEEAPATSVYIVSGGAVRLRVDGTDVYLLGLIPQPGFRAKIISGGPAVVEVEFRSSTIAATFTAYVEDGELVTEQS